MPPGRRRYEKGRMLPGRRRYKEWRYEKGSRYVPRGSTENMSSALGYKVGVRERR
jgi:hypothetical protein